jgi:hypothetical protein
MDVTCGGRWWRRTAVDAYQASHKENFEPAAEAVVRAYAQRLASSSGMLHVTVPVASYDRRRRETGGLHVRARSVATTAQAPERPP